jgi:hypothetical protein
MKVNINAMKLEDLKIGELYSLFDVNLLFFSNRKKNEKDFNFMKNMSFMLIKIHHDSFIPCKYWGDFIYKNEYFYTPINNICSTYRFE